jgi:hypothetical protein
MASEDKLSAHAVPPAGAVGPTAASSTRRSITVTRPHRRELSRDDRLGKERRARGPRSLSWCVVPWQPPCAGHARWQAAHQDPHTPARLVAAWRLCNSLTTARRRRTVTAQPAGSQSHAGTRAPPGGRPAQPAAGRAQARAGTPRATASAFSAPSSPSSSSSIRWPGRLA